MTPGKKALITGGSSALAIELGSRLFNQGYTVYLTSRSLQYLQQAKKAFPCTILAADLATDEGQELIIEWIYKESFDLVINNAGLGFYGNTCDLEDIDIIEICQVNIIALTRLCKAAAIALKNQQKEGIIVNISSATDRLVFPTFACYAASKSYVTAFSLAFAEEMQPYNIAVYVAAPGQIQTRFQERASKGFYKQPHQGLEPSKAAEKILWMLEKKKRYYVFPWKTRCLRRLHSLLPGCLRYYLLKKGIAQRIRS